MIPSLRVSLSISSYIRTSQGTQLASWNQSLVYTNHNALTDQGSTQVTNQNTTGFDAASPIGYGNIYSYPLIVYSSFATFPSGAFSINASVSRGLDFNVLGTSVFPSGIQSFDVTSPATIPVPGRPQPQTRHSTTLATKFQRLDTLHYTNR